MNKKRILTITILAAVVLFSAWMLWPRPLADAFDAAAQMNVMVIRSGVDHGKPWMGSSETYDLEAGSGQGAAVQAVLEEHSYHLCLDTLTNECALDGLGDLGIRLYNDRENSLSVYEGSGKIFLSGRIVRVGYGGSGETEELCADLLAALRSE